MLQSDIQEWDPSIATELANFEVANPVTFLGAPLIEVDSLMNLIIRFAFNLLVGFILCYFAYYRKSKRRDYFITFMLFSSTMFLLIVLMENVKLQIGFTLGLFAIFGMIRYRTETVPIREMTYLFVIIGLSVINGLSMTVSYAELVLTNALMLTLAFVLENTHTSHKSAKIILYDKIENIVPERREELLADLTARTGLKIDHIEIGHIDFLRDVAFIKVYYFLPKGEENTIDNLTKMPK